MEIQKDSETLWNWADKASVEYTKARERLIKKHGSWDKAKNRMPHNLKIAHELKRIFPSSLP